MKSEKSCGGIIINEKSQYLIIKNKNANEEHWGFPKGHVEKGETEEETALREIYEEVGLRVKILKGCRESISYIDYVRKVNKTAVYFICRADNTNVKYIHDEVEQHLWLDYKAALKRITYDNAKELLKKAHEFLKK